MHSWLLPLLIRSSRMKVWRKIREEGKPPPTKTRGSWRGKGRQAHKNFSLVLSACNNESWADYNFNWIAPSRPACPLLAARCCSAVFLGWLNGLCKCERAVDHLLDFVLKGQRGGAAGIRGRHLIFMEVRLAWAAVLLSITLRYSGSAKDLRLSFDAKF